MSKKADNIQEAYFEKTDRLETWSGLPVKGVYTPVEATKGRATMGEIMGTIREAYGHHYDPLKIIESPFMGIS